MLSMIDRHQSDNVNIRGSQDRQEASTTTIPETPLWTRY